MSSDRSPPGATHWASAPVVRSLMPSGPAWITVPPGRRRRPSIGAVSPRNHEAAARTRQARASARASRPRNTTSAPGRFDHALTPFASASYARAAPSASLATNSRPAPRSSTPMAAGALSLRLAASASSVRERASASGASASAFGPVIRSHPVGTYAVATGVSLVLGEMRPAACRLGVADCRHAQLGRISHSGSRWGNRQAGRNGAALVRGDPRTRFRPGRPRLESRARWGRCSRPCARGYLREVSPRSTPWPR